MLIRIGSSFVSLSLSHSIYLSFFFYLNVPRVYFPSFFFCYSLLENHNCFYTDWFFLSLVFLSDFFFNFFDRVCFQPPTPPIDNDNAIYSIYISTHAKTQFHANWRDSSEPLLVLSLFFFLIFFKLIFSEYLLGRSDLFFNFFHHIKRRIYSLRCKPTCDFKNIFNSILTCYLLI